MVMVNGKRFTDEIGEDIFDEDEEYVKETEGEFEGDEYVSVDDDDLFSDEDGEFDDINDNFGDDIEF